MAHSKQARKRIRQNATRRTANKSVASAMRTSIKKLEGLVASGEKEQAEAALPQTLSRIDKAAKDDVVHANAAARKKGQMMRAVGRMG